MCYSWSAELSSGGDQPGLDFTASFATGAKHCSEVPHGNKRISLALTWDIRARKKETAGLGWFRQGCCCLEHGLGLNIPVSLDFPVILGWGLLDSMGFLLFQSELHQNHMCVCEREKTVVLDEREVAG